MVDDQVTPPLRLKGDQKTGEKAGLFILHAYQIRHFKNFVLGPLLCTKSKYFEKIICAYSHELEVYAVSKHKQIMSI